MWDGAGAAVQGRWRGELGEAFTGRNNCWLERGEGMKSRDVTEEESRRVEGTRGKFERVCAIWEEREAVGESGFSRSEQ
jgi:hypothetical protein